MRTGVRRARREAPAAAARRLQSSVKRNTAPAAGAAIEDDVAAHARTIRREMARPRPAPPWRRVSAVSTCSNSPKMRSASSGGMPGPLSATAKTMRSAPVTAVPRSTEKVTPPASVNLTPLPARLRSTWRSRARSTSTAGRRGPSRGNVDALGVGAGGEQLGDLLQQRLELGRLGPEIEAAGLDLGKVEHVVDQRQQRLAGGVDARGRRSPGRA